MSVRIYQLSKELGMENKEVIALLQERGLDVKSASNTIPNIYADSFIEEFQKKKQTSEPSPKEDAPEKPTQAAAPQAEKPARPSAPSGRFVKTVDDLEKERSEAIEAKAPAQPPAQPQKPQQMQSTSAPKPAPIPGVKAAPKLPNIAGGAPKLPPIRSNTPPLVKLPEQNVAKPTEAKPNPTLPATDNLGAAPTQPASTGGTLHVKPPIVVRDFALQMEIKPFRLISELMEMGIFASMNQTIEENIAQAIAKKHGFTLEIHHRGEQQQQEVQKKKVEKPKVDESKLLEPRPPVVCVLGHVDHGKTTLLDTIRKANVVSGEAGGITQHIGAYQVTHNDHKITFIDTPGHAAFSKMRERGANLTDIAILVIAADDGFKPQTKEALKFAQRANVPIVVAINKMDAPGANIERAKVQMQEHNIAPEDWGGETLTVPVSALKGEGIDGLLESILLQAEVLELKANPKCPAEGVVVESQIEVGRGPTATVIIQKGTLNIGDALVCGSEYCKVRALMDENGNRLKSAPPSTPVLILGWSGAPDAGAILKVVKNEREAKREAEDNLHREKTQAAKEDIAQNTAMDLDALFSAIQNQQQKTLKVLIKADVHGSAEALRACLLDIKSDKVNLEVIESSVGYISKSDIEQAHAAHAVIVGFNTKLDQGVQALAKHHDVRIVQHNIIYELIDQVKECMAELLDPEIQENKLGAAEVRQVFKVSKGGAVAGCMVTEGKISKSGFARITRNGKAADPIHKGRVETLKRFKEDVTEVRAGYECGIQIGGFSDYKEGDIIECFEIIKIKPTL